MRTVILTLVLLASSAAAQPGPGACCMGPGARASGAAPIAANPVVSISGVIAEVRISPGQGMPYLDVKQGNESTRLYLGSMRYLIDQNFNPKAGQQVTAKGYKVDDAVIGIEVSLPAEKKTLKLRDEKGWPLWRGGRFGAGPPWAR